ncbi:RNA 3'-terminal phosphate cyclase [Candidatus Bathyarchaeota archaeon]|nr:RNA 3'-terminal phosphate cyclase [Candidatus Bathyarchaeota archaeon]
MIEIDGSYGEGGGQILRSSLALAAAIGKEVHIFNIRAGRSEPGLKAQHLTAAKAVADLCNATYQGLEIGSTEFVFKPGPIKGGRFRFDVGTAGSVTLVLQALTPMLPFASDHVSLEIRGGTDVKWSPPVDYLCLVLIPILARIGVEMSLQVVKRGHYPKGGGIVRLDSTPSGRIRPIESLTAGNVTKVEGISHGRMLPRHVADRQAAAARQIVIEKGLPEPELHIDASGEGSQLSAGSGIALCAKTENAAILGADCLGERGVSAEKIGSTAAHRLVEEIETNCFLDRHMGDMIVPYLALANGLSNVSVSRITQHTMTNVRVAEMVSGVEFAPVGNIGQPGRLHVRGLGISSDRVVVSSRESRPIANS